MSEQEFGNQRPEVSGQKSEPELTPEESEVDLEMVQELRRLVPARPALRATSVFAEAFRRAEAARRSARRQAWIWRGVAAGLAASVVVMAWTNRPNASIPQVGSFVGLEAPPLVTPIPIHSVSSVGESALPDCSYLILRQRVLAQDMAGLPAASRAPQAPLPLPGEQMLLERRLGNRDGV